MNNEANAMNEYEKKFRDAIQNGSEDTAAKLLEQNSSLAGKNVTQRLHANDFRLITRQSRAICKQPCWKPVYPTKDGTPLLTDSTGRLIASLSADDNRTAILVAEVPAKYR